MQLISGHYYMKRSQMGEQKWNECVFKCRSLVGGLTYFYPIKGVALPKLVKGDVQDYVDVTSAFKRIRAISRCLGQEPTTTISSAMEGHVVNMAESSDTCLIVAVTEGVAFAYNYDRHKYTTYKTSELVTDFSALGDMAKQMVDAGDAWEPPLFTGALKKFLGMDCSAVVTYMMNNVPEEYREDYEDCIQAIVDNPDYNGQNPLEVLKGYIATKYGDNPPGDCWTQAANELQAAIPKYTDVDKAVLIFLAVPNSPIDAWAKRFPHIQYPKSLSEFYAIQSDIAPARTTQALCAIFGVKYTADEAKDSVSLKEELDKYLNVCGMLGMQIRDAAGYSPIFMSSLYIPIFHRMYNGKLTWEGIREIATSRGLATCTNQDVLYAFCKAALLLHLNTNATQVYNGIAHDVVLPGGLDQWVTTHMEGKAAAFPDPEDETVTATDQTTYLDFGKNDIVRALSAALEVPGNQATPERLNKELVSFYASIGEKNVNQFFESNGEPAEQTRHNLLYILGDILVHMSEDKKSMCRRTPPPPTNIFAKLIAELNKCKEWPTPETLDAFIDGIKL